MVKVYQSLKNFKDQQDSFGAWVRTIAARTLVDFYRESGQQRKMIDSFSDISEIGTLSTASSQNVEQQVIANEMATEIIRWLRESGKITLQELDLLLQITNGISPGEYAEQNGITPGSLRVKLHRLRTRVKNIVDDPTDPL